MKSKSSLIVRNIAVEVVSSAVSVVAGAAATTAVTMAMPGTAIVGKNVVMVKPFDKSLYVARKATKIDKKVLPYATDAMSIKISTASKHVPLIAAADIAAVAASNAAFKATINAVGKAISDIKCKHTQNTQTSATAVDELCDDVNYDDAE